MEATSTQPNSKLLPSRPVSAPGGRYQLPGARFTAVPARREAEIKLPPMRLRRSLAEKMQQAGMAQKQGQGQSTQHASRPRSAPHAVGAHSSVTVLGSRAGHAQECQGDFCNAEIRYPASLQDLESSQHPWMKQARELCNRSLGDKGLHKLMLPTEMVGCLQLDLEEKDSKRVAIPKKVARPTLPEEQRRPAARFGSTGFVNASWICEARAYPSLCQWLQSEAGWLLDPKDADRVAEAASKMLEDESRAGGPPHFRLDGSTPALQYRLRILPVCGSCFCIHSAIHTALVMLRVHKRGLWAQREKRRKLEREEQERREQMESYLQRERPPRRRNSEAVEEAPPRQLCRSVSAPGVIQQSRRSCVMDAETATWLHSVDFDAPSPNLGSGASMERTSPDLELAATSTASSGFESCSD